MSSLDVSTLIRSEKLACEIEISAKIRYDILPNISKMKPKWPSQLREYVPKLKNLCKFEILTNKKVFLLYSSVYYRYRLNRKKSLQFTLFSMIIFMMIHIIHLWATLKLLQYFHEISGNMPLPKRPKIVFLAYCANNIEHFF